MDLARTSGWLLVGGMAVFFVGAGAWSLGFQAPVLADTLRNVGHAPARWLWIHAWMAAGVLVTVAGLTAWAEDQREVGERLATPIGGVLYLAGAILWLVSMGLRVTVQTWAASETIAAAVPGAYPALHGLSGVLYAAHMVLSYLAASALGLGILWSGVLPAALGWAGVVGGLTFAAGFILARGGLWGMPFLAHVYTCALGIALLRGR